MNEKIKKFYEIATDWYIPRKGFTIIRLNGDEFQPFIESLDKPWDEDFLFIMKGVTDYLCKKIPGAKFAFTHFDEISILLEDLEDNFWLDGNIQKIASVSSSMATFAFTEGMRTLEKNKFFNNEGILKEVFFNSKIFIITQKEDVINYFISRQKISIQNIILRLSNHLFPSSNFNGMSIEKLIIMCKKNGVDWEKQPISIQRGCAFYFDTTSELWMFEENLPLFSENKSLIEKNI